MFRVEIADAHGVVVHRMSHGGDEDHLESIEVILLPGDYSLRLESWHRQPPALHGRFTIPDAERFDPPAGMLWPAPTEPSILVPLSL